MKKSLLTLLFLPMFLSRNRLFERLIESGNVLDPTDERISESLCSAMCATKSKTWKAYSKFQTNNCETIVLQIAIPSSLSGKSVFHSPQLLTIMD